MTIRLKPDSERWMLQQCNKINRKRGSSYFPKDFLGTVTETTMQEQRRLVQTNYLSFYANIDQWDINIYDVPHVLYENQRTLIAIKDIKFNSLKWLILQGLELQNIQVLGLIDCPSLKRISSGRNKIRSLSPLARTNFRHLQCLTLHKNLITRPQLHQLRRMQAISSPLLQFQLTCVFFQGKNYPQSFEDRPLSALKSNVIDVFMKDFKKQIIQNICVRQKLTSFQHKNQQMRRFRLPDDTNRYQDRQQTKLNHVRHNFAQHQRLIMELVNQNQINQIDDD